jgi:osmoprotectant transport system permease protein
MLLQQILDFIRDPNNDFSTHLAQAFEISIIPILLAMLVGIPLGVFASGRPLLAFLGTNITGLARAIPTLAFLVGVVTLLQGLNLKTLSLGLAPTVIALALIGIPPILLNSIAGLQGVDPASIEAGRGMGMTPSQVFLRIQVPVALPVMAAGVRTAAVQIVATTPLAALVGAGGWGDYILQGISDGIVVGGRGWPPLLVGAVPLALMALLAEYGLAWVQRALTPAGLRVVQAASDAEAIAREPVPASA